MNDIESHITFKHDEKERLVLTNDTLQNALPHSAERGLYEQQIDAVNKNNGKILNIFGALALPFLLSLVASLAMPAFMLLTLAIMPVMLLCIIPLDKTRDKITALNDAEKARIKNYFTENPNGKKLLLKIHAEKLAAEKAQLASALKKVKQEISKLGTDASLTHDAAPAESAKIAAQPIVLPGSATRPAAKIKIGLGINQPTQA